MTRSTRPAKIRRATSGSSARAVDITRVRITGEGQRVTERMNVLPDLLRRGLDLVIVGTAAGRASAERGAYYAGRGNRIWHVLYEAGLTAIRLGSSEYRQLLRYDIGLTDIAKHSFGIDRDLSKGCFDAPGLQRKIEAIAPRILAFNGKTAASAFFSVSTRKLAYGRQGACVGRTVIFICPQTSAANGHWSQEPWCDLAREVARIRIGQRSSRTRRLSK